MPSVSPPGAPNCDVRHAGRTARFRTTPGPPPAVAGATGAATAVPAPPPKTLRLSFGPEARAVGEARAPAALDRLETRAQAAADLTLEAA